jgi:hypothetical protein
MGDRQWYKGGLIEETSLVPPQNDDRGHHVSNQKVRGFHGEYCLLENPFLSASNCAVRGGLSLGPISPVPGTHMAESTRYFERLMLRSLNLTDTMCPQDMH